MRQILLALLIGVFLLAASRQASAQRSEYLFEDIRLSGVYGGGIFNFSYFDGDPKRVFGGYFAFGFDQVVSVGWQWMKMKDRLELDDQLDNTFLKYNGFMVDFTPWGRKVIHPDISFVIGPGRYFTGPIRKRVLVMQPSAGIELNVWRILKLGLEGGYRFILRNDGGPVETEDLQSPFFQIDLRFGWSW